VGRALDIVLVTVAAVALVAAAGCGSDGKTLRDPPPGATSPAPTSTTTSTTAPAVFAVSSPAFAMGGVLPGVYTCDAGVSPPLQWGAIPPNTVELALTITTTTDRPVHWIVTGLPPTSTGIAEATVPLEGIEGPNSDGDFGYWPPCPAVGTTQQLDITLYALEQPSMLTPEMTPDEAIGHIAAIPGTRTVTVASVTG
jgi:phosphatidylethanolamine-binding protein (PEBP) family uncharacterized protein